MSFVSMSDLQTILTDLGNKLRRKPTAIRLTQAEYDALTSEEKHDTTKTYYVTDGQGGGGNTLTVYPVSFNVDLDQTYDITSSIPSDGQVKSYSGSLIQKNITFEDLQTAFDTAFYSQYGIHVPIKTVRQQLSGSNYKDMFSNVQITGFVASYHYDGGSSERFKGDCSISPNNSFYNLYNSTSQTYTFNIGNIRIYGSANPNGEFNRVNFSGYVYA